MTPAEAYTLRNFVGPIPTWARELVQLFTPGASSEPAQTLLKWCIDSGNGPAAFAIIRELTLPTAMHLARVARAETLVKNDPGGKAIGTILRLAGDDQVAAIQAFMNELERADGSA